MKYVLLSVSFFLFSFMSLYAGDTTITGARMELKQKGEVVYFSGGVRLERNQDIIKASEMETNKTRDKIKANGKVEFFRRISDSETCVGLGDRAFYSTDKGEGYLIGSSTWAHVIYTQIVSSTVTHRVDIYADRFDFLKASTNVVGTGHAHGFTTDPETHDFYEFWANEADYRGKEKIIILKGPPKPHAEQTNININEKKVIHGNVLTYDLERKGFLSEGESRAIFTHVSSETQKNNRK